MSVRGLTLFYVCSDYFGIANVGSEPKATDAAFRADGIDTSEAAIGRRKDRCHQLKYSSATR